MYKVMLSARGLPVVVSTNDTLYAEMLLIGTYTEHCSGTKTYCDKEAEKLTEEFIGCE